MEEIIQQIITLESEAAALAKTIADGTAALRAQQTEKTRLANELRAQVIKELQESGVVKEEQGQFVISLKRGLESIDVPDVEALPDEYIRIKKEPDKIKIKAERPDTNWYKIVRGEDTLQIKAKSY